MAEGELDRLMKEEAVEAPKINDEDLLNETPPASVKNEAFEPVAANNHFQEDDDDIEKQLQARRQAGENKPVLGKLGAGQTGELDSSPEKVHNKRNYQNAYTPGYGNGNQNFQQGFKNQGYRGPQFELTDDELTADVDVSTDRIALDSYTADLNVHVETPDALSAYPCTTGVSGWIFGNVRCTHGIQLPIESPPSYIKTSSNKASSSRRIKCGFEVQIDRCLQYDTHVVPRAEHRDAHFIRVGWSEVNCQGNLGEERNSIGLDSLGRVLAEGQCFRHEYSKSCTDLKEGDVIGAYVEFCQDTETAHFSFRVNDKNLGVLAKIPAKPDKAVFVPHILTRNIRFKANFGTLCAFVKRRKKRSSPVGSTFGSSEEESDLEAEQAVSEILSQTKSMLPEDKNYTRVLPEVPPIDPNESNTLDYEGEGGALGDEEKDKKGQLGDRKTRYAPLIGDDFHTSRIVRCAGFLFREQPKDISECEVMMCMGLPGSGKTTWCSKYIKSEEGRHKRYTVIGTEQILSRMAILGKPRRYKPYNKMPDPLRLPISHIQSKWLDISLNRKRNYILDQLNVFPGSHKKKMNRFEGFERTACVILPSDEEYKKRLRKREDYIQCEIPKKNILELKNGIALPGREIGMEGLFTKVLYPDLEEEDAAALITQYREEAKDHGGPPEKRFRGYLQNQYGQRGRDEDGYVPRKRYNEQQVTPMAGTTAAAMNPLQSLAHLPAEQQQQWAQYYQQVYQQYYQQYAQVYGQQAQAQAMQSMQGQNPYNQQ